MDRIVNLYKKIREDSRLSTLVVSALCVCLIAVVVLFVRMPELKAAENTVTWVAEATGEFKLTTLPDGNASAVTLTTIDVVANTASNPYIIDGTGLTNPKSNVSIVINYSGNTGTSDNPEKVYVKLIDVDVTQSLDYSVLRFTSGGSPVDFVVTVQGECDIKSEYQGANTPLIEVVDTSYTLYRLKSPSGMGPYTLDSYVKQEIHGKQVGLILQGQTPASSLKLTNAAGSFGALIGSSEAESFAVEDAKSRNNLLQKLNTAVMSEGEISISDGGIVGQLKANPYYFTEFNYQPGIFQPQYKYKSTNGVLAGDITIGGENGLAPLELTLTHNGYGAAIGGGGSTNPNSFGVSCGTITINNGTINVASIPSGAVSPVFGSGVAKDAPNLAASYGEHGGVVINGGSISFGTYNNMFGNTTPVNGEGDRLYQVRANTKDTNTGYSIRDVATLPVGDLLPIDYEYSDGLQFEVDLRDPQYTTSMIAGPGGTPDIPVNVLSLDVTLSPTFTYSYLGRGHSIGNNRDYLYLWLPAIETTSFSITDEFGIGKTEFTLKTSGGVVVDPISADKNSENNRKYVLVRGETYYLIVDKNTIPAGLSVNNVKLSTGGNAPYIAARGYEIATGTNPSIVADVSYAGSIDIVYNDGLLDSDRLNHNVTMPTQSYEYGNESYELPHLGTIYKNMTVGGQVKDIIFTNWVYTDEQGNELGNITHIVKSNSFDGNQRKYSDIVQSDGKIYIKAKWKIVIEHVIGEDATINGNIPVVELTYAYGTGNVTDVNITQLMPVKDTFAFMGWTLDDDETTMYEYAVGSANTVSVSTLTSHVFYANYERTGFGVYIDSATLDQNYAQLSCIGQTGVDMLVRNADGTLATVVIDGKTYYYTGVVRKGTTVGVRIQTKHGYRMDNTSVKVTGSASSDISTDSITGECVADILIETQDVYVTTNATFRPVEYEIIFKDGKTPSEPLWSSVRFNFDIEDIASNKTVGDIIRDGLSMSASEMSDSDIAAYINTIPKNNRFTDFSGWSIPFYAGEISMDKTIASIYAENTSITYGDMVFTANWAEYDKFVIDVELFEREFYSDGSYRDKATDKVVPVLYYYSDGSNKKPIYTEEITDPVTGQEKIIAYAKAGDKVEVALFRVNENGKPYGEAVTDGIKLEELYYEYESKLDEAIHADIKDGSNAFTVKDDVKDDTVINIYMAFSLKKFNIVYWDLRGFDNSANPTTYTIFDEIEFEPIAFGVDWLLVCPDDDSANDDDVKTEVIYKVLQDGKLVTDGTASQRDYMSNLILKPDWSAYSEDSYNIRIVVENSAFGKITIIYPKESSEFFADDMVILSVEPKDGYKLVPNSLKYKKENTTPVMRAFGERLLTKGMDTFIISPVDEESGTYLFTMPNCDIVVSAEFELCQYDIIYSDVTSDMTNVNPHSYNVNSDITLVDAVREGYTFLGWFDKDGNQVTRIIGKTGNLVLTPRFELASKPDDEEPDNGAGDNTATGDEPGAGNNGATDNKPNAGNDGTGDNGATDNKPGTGDNGTTGNKPGTGSDGSGNSGTNNDGTNAGAASDSSVNKPPSNNGGNATGNATISGRPSNVVSRPSNSTINNIRPSVNVQTGDETNVPRLILICAAAVLILMIVVLKKPADKDENDKEE